MSDNRILIGNHPNHGYGLYVSKAGTNVLGSDNSQFLFDSGALGQAQLLAWHEIVTTSSHNGSTTSFDYDSYGMKNFAMAFSTQITYASEDKDDITCASEAVNGTRSSAISARYSLFGGQLGGVNSTTDLGNDITFTLTLSQPSSSVGRCTIGRTSPSSSAKDFIVSVLIFAQET